MLRHAGLALIVLSLLIGAVGTTAFSTTAADRGVAVAIADDAEAYIGYDPATINTTGGEEETLVTVTNRFHDSIDVTDVSVDTGSVANLSIDDGSIQLPTDIGEGESAGIDAEIECQGIVEEERVTATITVQGTSVSATVSGDPQYREVTVSCYP